MTELETARVFPRPETNMARLISDHEFRRTYRARLKTWNPFVVLLYRMGLSALLGMKGVLMILTTRGRRSGRLRSIPIGFFLVGSIPTVFSAWGKSANWYKNLLACPQDVWIQIGMRRRRVRPAILHDPGEIQAVLQQFIAESPLAAQHIFGWDPLTDRIEAADFSPVIQNVSIVRFFDAEESKR